MVKAQYNRTGNGVPSPADRKVVTLEQESDCSPCIWIQTHDVSGQLPWYVCQSQMTLLAI